MYRTAELAASRRRDSAAPEFPREAADDKGSQWEMKPFNSLLRVLEQKASQ